MGEYSSHGIAAYLKEKGVKTATGNTKWHDTVIMKMLKNEKYMGDALLQKTYTVDFMTKKKVLNNGIVPQYYVTYSSMPEVSKVSILAREASISWQTGSV